MVMPEELDESITPELRGELSRAREIVGLEFVAKMKLKLKEITLKRIEAEKESIDAVVEDEVCFNSPEGHQESNRALTGMSYLYGRVH